MIGDSNTAERIDEYPDPDLRVHAKPFLKWAGGKRKLIPRLKTIYPDELKTRRIANYFEPFLGSGAIFLDIVQNYSVSNAFLSDVNEDLILTYQVVQKDVFKLIDRLMKYESSFLRLNREERNIYFYGLRWKFNSRRPHIDFKNYSERWIVRAAQNIFINKTCFNGLYRVNSKGDFNSAVGDYKNPRICDADNLIRVSNILANADIRVASFQEMADKISAEDFVYFDPPYRPLKSSSFVSYSATKFGDREQIKLSKIFHSLDNLGTKLMLSNSDPASVNPGDDFFDRLYSRFNIRRIPAPRFINSKAECRGCVSEIVVTNY